MSRNPETEHGNNVKYPDFLESLKRCLNFWVPWKGCDGPGLGKFLNKGLLKVILLSSSFFQKSRSKVLDITYPNKNSSESKNLNDLAVNVKRSNLRRWRYVKDVSSQCVNEYGFFHLGHTFLSWVIICQKIRIAKAVSGFFQTHTHLYFIGFWFLACEFPIQPSGLLD